MTVSELIAALQEMPGDAVVTARDENDDMMIAPVTEVRIEDNGDVYLLADWRKA